MENDSEYADRLVTRLRRHIPWRDTYKVTEVIIDHIGPQQKAKILNYFHTLHLNPNIEQTGTHETFVSVDVHSDNRVFEQLLAFLHDVGAEDTSSVSSEIGKQKAPEIEDSEEYTFKNNNTPTTTSETQSSSKQIDSQSSGKQTISHTFSKQTASEYELIISQPREPKTPVLSSSPEIENSNDVIKSLLKDKNKSQRPKQISSHIDKKHENKDNAPPVHRETKHSEEQVDKKKPWYQGFFKKKRKEERQAELLRTVHIVAVNDKDDSSSTVTFTQGIREILNAAKSKKKTNKIAKKENSSTDSDKLKSENIKRKASKHEHNSNAHKTRRARNETDKETSKEKKYKNKSIEVKDLNTSSHKNKSKVDIVEGDKKETSLVVETWTQTLNESEAVDSKNNLTKAENSTQTAVETPVAVNIKDSKSPSSQSINKSSVPNCSPVCLEQSVKTLQNESSSESTDVSTYSTQSSEVETCTREQYAYINGTFQNNMFTNTIPLYSPTVGMNATYSQYFGNNAQYLQKNNVIYKLRPVVPSNFDNNQIFFRHIFKEIEESDDSESTVSVEKVEKGIETAQFEPKQKDIGIQKQSSHSVNINENKSVEKDNIFNPVSNTADSKTVLLLEGPTTNIKKSELALTTNLANVNLPKINQNQVKFRKQDHMKRGILWGQYPDGRYGWGQCYAPGRVLPVTTWGPDYSVGRPMSNKKPSEKSQTLLCSKLCNSFSRKRQLKQEIMRQKQELMEIKMILFSCLHQVQSHLINVVTEDPLQKSEENKIGPCPYLFQCFWRCRDSVPRDEDGSKDASIT